ncbi:MAG: GPR endopeptidase [Clostridia bacterium]|nr:GPR endopeptidase [Clostridia bacterium]
MKYSILECEAAQYSVLKGKKEPIGSCEVTSAQSKDGSTCYTVMPKGRDKTVRGGRDNLSDFYAQAGEALATCLARLIKKKKYKQVLIVGLGNRGMTADALGNKVISKIDAGGNSPHISLIAPQVSIATGIDSSDVVHGVIGRIKPDLIILTDTLATAYYDRLGACYQVVDKAIVPGSGVSGGNGGYANLSAPVISIGAPLVITARALGLDIDDAFTPADIDLCVERCGNDIAYAIKKSLGKVC